MNIYKVPCVVADTSLLLKETADIIRTATKKEVLKYYRACLKDKYRIFVTLTEDDLSHLYLFHIDLEKYRVYPRMCRVAPSSYLFDWETDTYIRKSRPSERKKRRCPIQVLLTRTELEKIPKGAGYE